MRLFRVELTCFGLFFLMVAGLLVFGALSGCSGLSYRSAQGSERCRDLELRYQGWGALSIGATAVAGSGAFSTAFPEDRNVRLGLGIMSAAVVGLGAAALFVRDDVLSLYTMECGEMAEPLDPIETGTVSE